MCELIPPHFTQAPWLRCVTYRVPDWEQWLARRRCREQWLLLMLLMLLMLLLLLLLLLLLRLPLVAAAVPSLSLIHI